MSSERFALFFCKIALVTFFPEDLLAFDKPYQVAYSRAPQDQAELLRILPQLTSRVVPNIGRLRIVKSIAKAVTGVLVFAKFVYFCIVFTK